MDKIQLLQARQRQVEEAGTQIRKEINSLIDENSFVESSVFSFSKNDFYSQEAEGEGVVTGFGTIEDTPFYIVAQNSAVLSGGMSKANCHKIAKCMEQAEKTDTPILYMLSTKGVQVGEGVNVLEGLADLLLRASRLKGVVPQYLVVNGEVYGQIAVLAGLCDFTFFLKEKSVLATNSPLVISATSGKNLAKEKVGGVDGLTQTNLCSFVVDSLKDVRETIVKVLDLCDVPMTDCADLNESIPALDQATTVENLMKVFDKGTVLELGASYASEVKCVLGRIGGIAVACTVFHEENGVCLTAQNVRKLKDFAELVNFYELPYITFVNTLGIKTDLTTNNSLVVREISEYVSILDCIDKAKISVVYGKAIGLGYTLFAAKSMGYDYSFAFANAKIALFDSVQGAEIEFGNEQVDKQAVAARYADENSDPVNAAKNGYIDNIIEPALVKQYLIACLQMF